MRYGLSGEAVSQGADIVASSAALLTWPLGMSFVEDVSPPWKLVAFLGYAMLELACDIAFQNWLIAGALAGLFSMVFLSDPSSSGTVAGIIIVVVFGAFCGWLVELELNHRKSCPRENGHSVRADPRRTKSINTDQSTRGRVAGRSAMRKPPFVFLGPSPGLSPRGAPRATRQQQSFKFQRTTKLQSTIGLTPDARRFVRAAQNARRASSVSWGVLQSSAFRLVRRSTTRASRGPLRTLGNLPTSF